MTDVVHFNDPHSTDRAVVGGKGANLGRLTHAGFDVPDGFTVTTHAYERLVATLPQLAVQLAALEYDDSDALERGTAAIRAAIATQPIPEPIARAVSDALRALGDGPVAVRSSGTAEDLTGASFAGLHDTYLNIHDETDVLVALSRCWASLWSTRATAYRHRNGFDQAATRIAVIVQKMVAADVSGVMFTGNPLTTATDEIVVNASWGLGESVVSGAVTPDLFVVDHDDLRVKQRTLGSKKTETISAAAGTVNREVEPERAGRAALSDAELIRVADLGRRVQDHYEGFPQDIEWAIADGRTYLLQARPITGVEFSWDADLETEWPSDAADDDIWTRAFADEVSTGAISPLMYSYRYLGMGRSFRHMGMMLGIDELKTINSFKFYKAEVYYSCRMERALVERTGLPILRPMCVSMIPKAWASEVLAAPFSYWRYARMWLRATLIDREVVGKGIARTLQRLRAEQDSHGLTYEQLRLLSDERLKRYIDHMHELEFNWNDHCFTGFLVHFRDALAMTAWITQNWYTGSNANLFAELLSGSRESTDTQLENAELWELAETIRSTPGLYDLFGAAEPSGWLDKFRAAADGGDELVCAFLNRYDKFLAQYGHRGHTDRDVVYPRRSEDPSLDYRSLQFLLRAESPVHPKLREQEISARRLAAYEQVVQNLARGALGVLRVEIFKFVFDYVHTLVVVRDNERCKPTDIVTMAYKRGFLEMGRRLTERGLIDRAEDVYFLGKAEAHQLLDGNTLRHRLLKAKIAARRRDFERFYNREIQPPMYLRGYAPADPDGEEAEGELHGTPTAPGKVTAVARVVNRLDEIGKVNPGEILITNSTDPGWTPVFLVLSGVIVETGGLLSHSSCLAREYGLPAMQLPGASRSIPDGATITLDGNSGLVTIIDVGAGAPMTVGAG